MSDLPAEIKAISRDFSLLGEQRRHPAEPLFLSTRRPTPLSTIIWHELYSNTNMITFRFCLSSNCDQKQGKQESLFQIKC